VTDLFRLDGKAAVHMLTQHLAGELAPRILVNAIAPGLFESRMTKELLRAGSDAVGSFMPLGESANPTTWRASRCSSPAGPAATSPVQ
jgi:NAD(P)-dependent dehydrogenase (short-subunit alcohol dehydrogenase family)